MHSTIAGDPDGRRSGLDGRDIGTVVLPDAPAKLYVIASAEIRAKRRYQEIIERKTQRGEIVPPFEQIFEEIKLRDERDMGRAESPMRPAKDAVLIDTSEMDIEQAFYAALNAINERLGQA